MSAAARIIPMPTAQDVQRVPDELLVSKLPPPALRLWLAIRKRQGDNAAAWYPLIEYARMADVKEKEVYKYISLLEEYGWLRRGEGKHLTCLVGRVYDASRRGGKRETTPKEGGISTTPKEGGSTTPKEGVRLPPKKGVTPIRKESKQNPDNASAEFAVFWKAFAKSADKKKCERKWRRLTKTQRQAALANVEAYVAATPEVRYRKNPLTWLNGECWQDDLPAAEPLPALTDAVSAKDAERISKKHGLAAADWHQHGYDRDRNPLFRLSLEKRQQLGVA